MIQLNETLHSTVDPNETIVEAAESDRLFTSVDVHLLIVDDDPAICRLVQQSLADQPFTVDAVSDPTKVLSQLRSKSYHLIVMDYVIPGLEATEILNTIHETQPDASIIVVTAYPSMDSAIQCLRSRTDDYIGKPFEIQALRDAVVRCLEKRGLLRLSESAFREQLGQAIRDRRKAMGMTLAEMARRTKVSLGYLSQIELGKNSASIETLYRIATGLRVRVADLFLGVKS